MIVCRHVRQLFCLFVLLNIQNTAIGALYKTHRFLNTQWCVRIPLTAETYRLRARTWVQRFHEAGYLNDLEYVTFSFSQLNPIMPHYFAEWMTW